MRRWILLLALLPLVLVLCMVQSTDPQSLAGIDKSIDPQALISVDQSVDPQALVGIMRPVKPLPSQMPSSAEITFSEFEIQQMFVTNHPGTVAIKGEPTKGFRFFVEAKIYSWEAIATLKFEAVDEHGNVIQKIPIQRQPDANGGSGFYGVMKIPDRPFRVVMSGEGWDGRSYRLTYERLFRPTTRQQSAILIPGVTTSANQRQEAEKLSQDYLDKMEQDARNSGEMIVMPRTRVSNVMYGPYFSKAGRPLGIRITYDMEFSQDGYFNPELDLFLDYKKDDWRGRIDMKPLTGNIEPKPAESGSPQIQPHLLAFGAGYIYRAGTTYHFTAEYIPDYVIQNEKKTKFCIWYQQYKHTPEFLAAWRAILASEAPTKYTLSIDNTNFYGVIEDLHPQRTLFQSFVAEGALDCGEQPNRRF